MIIKSFNLNDLKSTTSKFFLFYGLNEGHKEQVIADFFLNNFKGEIIKYDENQILENNDIFFETCLNESLFETEKIILVSRVTSKLYEIVRELTEKKLQGKKIIFISKILEKKNKIRQLFEIEKDLVCIPFYEDNSYSLYKIADDIFKKNNVSISSESINLVVDKCAGDRINLQNEINKILNFSYKRNKISREQILKLINLYEDDNLFKLIDFCLAKNNMKVINIINNNSFNKSDTILLIRSFLSRLKRLLELKKLSKSVGSTKDTINIFKPTIFWKDKEIVEKQMENWTIEKIYKLIEKLIALELQFKKNYELSNNIIFDLILNSSRISNN